MKIISVLLLMLVGMTITAQQVEVPDAVLSAFKKDYSKAEEVSWGVEDTYFKAVFIYNNKYSSASYDEQGIIFSTSVQVDYSTLPLKGKKKIDNTYPSAMAEYVDRIEYSSGEIFYMVGIQSDGKEYAIRVSPNGDVVINEVVSPE